MEGKGSGSLYLSCIQTSERKAAKGCWVGIEAVSGQIGWEGVQGKEGGMGEKAQVWVAKGSAIPNSKATAKETMSEKEGFAPCENIASEFGALKASGRGLATWNDDGM